MSARFFSIKFCIAMLLTTNLVIEARAQKLPDGRLYDPSLGSNICEATRSASARVIADLRYQATGLPQSYSDCAADYAHNLALIKVELAQEYKFISCLQTEISRKKDDPAGAESLSKDMAVAAPRLRELRQNKPDLEQKAMAERKVCERAVDALSKYKSVTPPPTAKTFDGTYLGNEFVAGDYANQKFKHALRLTITGYQVSGSITPINRSEDHSELAISGKLSSDGRITATLSGTFHWESSLSGSKKWFSKPSQGTLNGSINDNAASGSTTHTGVTLFGSHTINSRWKAVRQ